VVTVVKFAVRQDKSLALKLKPVIQPYSASAWFTSSKL
jgi:hypothetical protein